MISMNASRASLLQSQGVSAVSLAPLPSARAVSLLALPSVLFVTGDIGGTNSRLQLIQKQLQRLPRPLARVVDKIKGKEEESEEEGEEVAGEVKLGEETYPSGKYASLEDCIQIFLDKYNPTHRPVYCMALAVAGPVANNVARITNLSWVIDGTALAKRFRMEHVRILNDFVGIGYGLLALKEDTDLEVVHQPPEGNVVQPHGVKAVIGAGTGLGECFLTHNGQHYDVWPAEGGHSDFAPRNQEEYEIMEYVKKAEKIDRVSVERVCSGLGLPRLYEYYAQKYPSEVNAEVASRMKSGREDVGKIIGQFASNGQCSICVRTMDAFVRCYGAETGNLALKTLPFSGLYIAGGIAAKSMDFMTRNNNQFVTHYLDKGRMGVLLRRIPIYLIRHPQVGLLGSRVICRRIIKEGVAGLPPPNPPVIPSKL